MRGQELRHFGDLMGQRITPADAGTRLITMVGLEVNGDHPRGCGDKFHSPNTRHIPQGSPPRMRGQGEAGYTNFHPERITPADAGTSYFRGIRDRPYTDHPRGCGDKGAIILLFTGLRGSPPRMRGQDN